MSEVIYSKKTTFLLAFVQECGNERKFQFQQSTSRIFRTQSVTHAGIKRGDHSVIAFCDHIHGDDYLTHEELLAISLCYLDGKFITHEIDLAN